MRFILTASEQELLRKKNVPFFPDKDYSDDEALDLHDRVREIEAFYAQNSDGESSVLCDKYTRLGDKIFGAIPED